MHRSAWHLAALIFVIPTAAAPADCPKQELAKPEGPGVRVSEHCAREEGTFFQGALWGKGKFTDHMGTVSEGDFQWGSLNGYGHVTKPGTNGRYNEHRGYFQNGDMYGPGSYRYQDGVVATGYFHERSLTGFGVLTYPNGVRMMGEFRGDEGIGEMLVVYPDGTKQKGEFRKLRYSLLRAGKTAPTPPAPAKK
jgi:hypothetical protein